MQKVVLILTASQRAELEHLAETTDDPGVRLRCLALLHMTQSPGYREVARVFAVNESAVRKWHAAYRQTGIAGLLTRPRSGRPPKLTDEDRRQLADALAQEPQTLGIPEPTWTARALNQYLQAISDTQVTDWTLWSFMRQRLAGRDQAGALGVPLSAPSGGDPAAEGAGAAGTQDDSAAAIAALRELVARLLGVTALEPEGTPPTPGAILLPVDVYLTDDAVTVMASLPGVRPEDVEISWQGATLTIGGEMPPPNDVQWTLQERRYGRFSRSLTLDVPVDVEGAAATFDMGVLTLVLPRADAWRARRIEIKSR
ncbi:MAG: helix-turn-helix domain-containing protein [Anaerolineae bacterium]